MRAAHFWVVGGDERQSCLARLLAEDGHVVHTYALEEEDRPRGTVLRADSPDGLWRADCVILPLPAQREEGVLNAPLCAHSVSTEEILEAMCPGQLLTGGKLGTALTEAAQRRGLRCRDYFQQEELAVANAVPTAEGAIQLAMENLPITLSGCRVLVLGYGRIGKLLARRLVALGAYVTVAARRYEQLAWAQADGCAAQHLQGLTGWLCGYDLVVNTVPALLLDRERLADLKPECLVFDLASPPGGVDRMAAEELGVKVLGALSLPGKVAPVTAARAIRESVYHQLEEDAYA